MISKFSANVFFNALQDFGLVVTRPGFQSCPKFCQGTAASWPQMNWTYTFDFGHPPQSKWTSVNFVNSQHVSTHSCSEKRWQERFQEAKAISPDTDSPWSRWFLFFCQTQNCIENRAAQLLFNFFVHWKNFERTLIKNYQFDITNRCNFTSPWGKKCLGPLSLIHLHWPMETQAAALSPKMASMRNGKNEVS